MADPMTYADSDEYVLVNPNDPKVGHLIYDAPMVDADTKQFIRDPETGKIKVYRMVIWGTKGLTQAQIEALITEKNASMVTKVNTLESRVSTFLDSDDATLDQLSELVTEIKANRANIALLVSDKATKTELADAVSTINSNIASSYMALANDQTVTGNKTFTGEVNVPTVDSADNSTKAASTAFVQEALGALTGTSTDNLVTKDVDQTITGLKTFNTLPQSSVTPTDDKDLATKKYVDDAVPTNMMTTDTAQNISGVKTFSNAIIGSITGNAGTATKATQDSDGNTIKSTYVKLSGDQTIAGTKTFSTTISGSITGSSGSCTGNAATATKATKDSDGNKISTTYVKLSGNQTIAGTKTFSSTISGNISGSSGSCTGNAATATKIQNAGNGEGTYVGSAKLGGALINSTSTTFQSLWNAPTKSYRVACATYSSTDEKIHWFSVSNTNIDSNTNKATKEMTWDAGSGTLTTPSVSCSSLVLNGYTLTIG